MFEVIISHVLTGKVRRAQFATRDEAERYLQREEQRVLNGRYALQRSLRDYRMEIHYRQPPVLRPLLQSPSTNVAA